MVQANQVVQTSGKIPFRYGSRRRIQRVGFIPYEPGKVAPPLQLPNVGYLAGLTLAWRATISGSANLRPGLYTAISLIRRFRLNLNLGSASVVDTSGHGLILLMSGLNGIDWRNMPHYGVSRTTMYVPVSVNLSENFSTGLILLQDPQIRATVEVQWNNPEDVFAGTPPTIGANSGLEIYYVYWEVPNLEKVSQPPLVLHRIVEDRTPVVSAHENVYIVPRQGILLQMLHAIFLDNSPAFQSWDKAYIRLNRVDTIAEITPEVAWTLQHLANREGFMPPSYMIPWNFFSANVTTNHGDLRDALDTEAVTTTESGFKLASDVSFSGSGNNYFITVRRILQPIQP
jgi:hypothetical protein